MCDSERIRMRPNAGGDPRTRAIVDLTEICSPKEVTRNNTNTAERRKNYDNGVISKRHGGSSMESNRSRRRRREDQSLGGHVSNGRNDTGKSKRREIDSGSRSTSTNSNKSDDDVIDVDRIGGNANASSLSINSSNHPSIESDRSNNSSNVSRYNDEDDILFDPAPRKRLPLNLNDKKKANSFEQPSGKQRKESKLKKRRVDGAVKTAATTEDNGRSDRKRNMQFVASSTTGNNDAKREGDWNVHNNKSMNSNEHHSSKKRVSSESTSYSKRQQQSSNYEPLSIREEKKEDTQTNQHGGGQLTDFFNQRKRPDATTLDDLMARATTILRQTFHHTSLRPLQETAVRGALQNQSQIVIMATGGGKSMCYQLPALAGGNNYGKVHAYNSSVTIVVCPLVALMLDQVNNLHRRGVTTAACLNGASSKREKDEIMNRLQIDKSKKDSKGRIKHQDSDTKLTPISLLYCTPELIETENFRRVLTKLHESNRLHMIAIDEAHCVSVWLVYIFVFILVFAPVFMLAAILQITPTSYFRLRCVFFTTLTQ